jgi:serine protease
VRRPGGFGVAALLTACSLIAACGGGGPTTTEAGPTSTEAAAPLFSYRVDPTLKAERGMEVAASGDIASQFVAGRIVVVFDDPAVLDGILARYGGTVVHRYSTADYGLAGPSVAVVEVDPATADLGSLSASMTSLGSDGTMGFGSEEGARVAAIAAAERAAGNRVALDWMVEPTSIPGSTMEEDSLGSGAWSPDAYQLPYYRRDAVQGIGVAEAWSLMYYAGVLDNRVPLAILDWGFTLDQDLRDPVVFSMDQTAFPFGQADETGFFHGYVTAATATAIPDNGYGIAGVAGVVAQPILIQMTDAGLSGDTEAILQAYSMGARIISMSFIAPILADGLPLADAFDEVTTALANAGVLMFASSGNGGGNVDEIVAERDALYGTRPCQAPGVICVGGLGDDSVERHEDSTYGNPGGSVDIYAPYCVYAVPPGYATRSVFHLCGTSFSAPFAAGVAALIWASNPDLSASEVWGLMESTALGARWPRVNALDAVAGALGAFTSVSFVEPDDGSAHDLGTALTLAAAVTIPTDPAVNSAQVRVRFTSDRDGLLDDHTWTVPMQHGETVSQQRASTVATSLSEGTHTITVTADYGDTEATDTLQISVGNTPPSDLRILVPQDGAQFCAGSPVQLRGDAFDVNQQLGLAESAFHWRSDRDGALGTGRNTSVPGLSAGTHRITMEVTDAGGLSSTTAVTVTVLSASAPECVDLPPVVQIVEPLDGTSYYVDVDIPHGLERGMDVDGQYVVVTLRAVVSDDHDAPGDLTVDFYVNPEWPDTWVGSGTQLEVRLHLRSEDALTKEIRVVVFDSAGNRSEDVIEVYVNRFH